jgi:2TM domain
VFYRSSVVGWAVTVGVSLALGIAEPKYCPQLRFKQFLSNKYLHMNFLKQSLTRSYNQEDVREIINIALENYSTLDTNLSYAQLLEIAQEISISPDSIELAKNQWIKEHEEIEKHRKFDLYRRSKLQERLSKYAIVNACLIPINFFTGFGVPWSLYILTSWGVVRGVAAWRVFFQRQGYGYERAFLKWQ